MKLVAFLAATCTAALVTSAQALVITDGDFSTWTFDSTGTATVTRETSGGNPGARLNITTISGPTVFGTGIKSDFSTNAPLAGANFTLSLDVLSGPGSFGQGQAIELLVEQNGTIYGTFVGITGFPLNFDTVIFNGVLDAGSFTRLIGAGPTTPGFDGGTATRFGFSGGNSSSGTLTQYYDNFNLAIQLQAQVSNTATLSSPTGGNVAPGTSVTDGATVTGGVGQPVPTGTVTFFLCQPNQVTAGQGCVSGGTQVGAVKTLNASGQATSDAASNTTAIGQYCWRAGYSGDSFYSGSNHTDATGECFTTVQPAAAIPTLSEWGLALMAVALAISGVAMMRRRRLA